MRGFDTNVLVRFLVRDDARQAEAVAALITAAVEEDQPIYLSTIVLCETVWVLESAYGYERGEIADALEKLLLTQQFEIEHRDHVWRALPRYRAGRADLADFLIGEVNHAAGCQDTATFDTALGGEGGFTVLS